MSNVILDNRQAGGLHAAMVERRPWLTAVPLIAIFGVLAALIAAWATTPRPALTPDSMFYLNAAENLRQGRGLVLSLTPISSPATTIPLTPWPPLYPVLLCVARAFSGDPVVAARTLQLITVALLAFPIGLLAYRIAGRGSILPTLAFYSVLRPEVLVASFTWSETTFQLCAYSAFALLVEGLRTENPRTPLRHLYLFLSGLAAGLAMLTRYLGLTVIAACMATVVLHAEDDTSGKRTIRKLSLIGLPAIIPNLIWLVRNLLESGHLWGEERGTAPFDLQAVMLGLMRTFWTDTVTPWTLDGHPLGLFLSILSVAGFLALVLAAMSLYGPDSTRGPSTRSRGASTLVTFCLIYTLTLIVVSLLIRFDPICTRLLVPIYPALLLLAGLFLRPAFATRARGSSAALRSIIIVAASVLFLAQVGSTMRYIRGPFESKRETAPYWRSIVFGDPHWSADPTIVGLQRAVPPQALVLSNIPDVITLWTDRSAKFVPYADELRIEEKIARFPGAYVLIHPDHRHPWVGIDELDRMVQGGRCESLGRCGKGYLYRVLG